MITTNVLVHYSFSVRSLNVYPALGVDSKKDTKKVKGVKRNDGANSITFDNYTLCLLDENKMTLK